MRGILTILTHALFSFLIFAAISACAADFAGSKDYPLIKRFLGAEIHGYDYKKFAEYQFQTSPLLEANKTREPLKAIQGTVTRIWYYIPGDHTTTEVFGNYINDLNGAGFKILWDSTKDNFLSSPNTSRSAKLHLADSYGDQNVPNSLGGRNVWSVVFLDTSLVSPDSVRKLTAHLSRGNGDVYVTLFMMRADKDIDQKNGKKGVYVALDVVEAGELKQQMVTVSASDMSKSISSTGRVTLYGIYFDTNKSDVKPNSEPALNEIVKLMKTEANLKLHVVGHTDNVGGLAPNMELSKRRAQAVVDALVKKFSIAPGRLIANGVAYLAPVASNSNEDGRALNRRVELVPQ
jgi:outer membrane protein OmpA-like peptidoglycan-associated protein